MSAILLNPSTPIPSIPWAGGCTQMGYEHVGLHPADFYDDIPFDSLRLWMHQHARYGLPTMELVDWLRELIGHRKAIEVGSGAGDLAHHLGIVATDSKIQNDPKVKHMYQLMGQPVIDYPECVQKFSATDAIEHFKPDVVIGQWVTALKSADNREPWSGSIYGLPEDEILDMGVTYVLIGSEKIHGDKPILKRPHTKHVLHFLRSRTYRVSTDCVWVWNP